MDFDADTAERREELTPRKDVQEASMQKKRIYMGIILNLFDGSGAGAATGGAGGEGDGDATSSVDSAAMQRGRELGLSDDLLDDYAAAFGQKGAQNAQNAQEDSGENNEDNNQEAEDSEDLDAEFEELVKGKYKDAYHKRTENFIKDRMGKANKDKAALKSKVEKSDKVLSLLAAKYGSDDPDAIYNALRGDSDVWRQMALDSGKSAEEVISGIDNAQAEKQREAELKNLRQYKAANELNSRLQSLAKETKKTYPDFDLTREFENPRFRAALDAIADQNTEQNRRNGTSNEVFDLTFAYELAHADELRTNTIKRTAKAAASAAMQTMQANRGRVRENAARPTAPSMPKSYAEMSDEEFAAYEERVRNGAAKI